MEASWIAAGLCVVPYVTRCLLVWFRAHRDSEAAVSQHRAGARLVEVLPMGSRVRMRSAAGDEVMIEVGQQSFQQERVRRGG